MASVIVGGARTPIAKMLGALAPYSAVDLGAIAIGAALERAQLGPERVDQVVLGHVLQAGCGQIPARQAAAKAGVPLTVPALAVNKVCLAGLNAVAMADMMIGAGMADVVVAGGMESMTHAPHLLPRSRSGIRYGNATMIDHVDHDALWDAFTDQSMGALTDSCDAGSAAVSRADADAFSARSHRLAASSAGILAEEIAPVRVPQRRGEDREVNTDEGVRPDSTVEALGRLRPAFTTGGNITAGSSSQLSDGAAAMVVMSEDAADRYGCTPLARVGAYGTVAGPDSSLQLQPARAIEAACKRQGIEPARLDVLEINEAFAAVGVASARELGLTEDDIEKRVNIHGGAIALGHPPGMSGARLVLHLAMELHRRGSGTAAAGLCGGGGQGDALILTAA
ncbi:MAG: acetyl-CoA C-acyltransferase [Streptosporangiales bacterium]